jgi:hypothetical protein
MITIDYKGYKATLKNGKWKTKDESLKMLLDMYTYDDIEGYTPFPDLSLAEIIEREHGAKIIKITGYPPYKEGTVY